MISQILHALKYRVAKAGYVFGGLELTVRVHSQYTAFINVDFVFFAFAYWHYAGHDKPLLITLKISFFIGKDHLVKHGLYPEGVVCLWNAHEEVLVREKYL
jgi:hypothetical protein